MDDVHEDFSLSVSELMEMNCVALKGRVGHDVFDHEDMLVPLHEYESYEYDTVPCSVDYS